MSTSPTTFRGEGAGPHGPDWSDHAELHRADDGGGVLHGMKAIRQGTLAALVRHVMALPEDKRAAYSITKAGDHVMQAGEIAALARRGDFPG